LRDGELNSGDTTLEIGYDHSYNNNSAPARYRSRSQVLPLVKMLLLLEGGPAVPDDAITSTALLSDEAALM